MRIFNTLHGGSQGSGRDPITAKEFLGKEGSRKYPSSIEAFLTYCKSLRELEIEQLEQFFSNVKAGRRYIGTIVTRMDKGNRPYKYITFNNLGGNRGVKVVVNEWMNKFINDYYDHKIQIDFTLEQLVEEAMND